MNCIVLLFTFFTSFSAMAKHEPIKSYVETIKKRGDFQKAKLSIRNHESPVSIKQKLKITKLAIIPSVYSSGNRIYPYDYDYQMKVPRIELDLQDRSFEFTDLVNIILINPKMEGLIKAVLPHIGHEIAPHMRNLNMLQASFALLREVLLFVDQETKMTKVTIQKLKNEIRNLKKPKCYPKALSIRTRKHRKKLENNKVITVPPIYTNEAIEYFSNIIRKLKETQRLRNIMSMDKIIDEHIKVLGKSYDVVYRSLIFDYLISNGQIPQMRSHADSIKLNKIRAFLVDYDLHKAYVLDPLKNSGK